MGERDVFSLSSQSSLCGLAFITAEEHEIILSSKEAVLLDSSKDSSLVAEGPVVADAD